MTFLSDKMVISEALTLAHGETSMKKEPSVNERLYRTSNQHENPAMRFYMQEAGKSKSHMLYCDFRPALCSCTLVQTSLIVS